MFPFFRLSGLEVFSVGKVLKISGNANLVRIS
jgi:hypothetical protein